VLSIVILAACATPVTTKQELFVNDHDARQKNCYSYDTVERSMARGLPTSVGLGIVGGLFPPLMIIAALGAGASAAADQAALPVKCGLTLEEAVKGAQDSSFYENATATWVQKDGLATIVVSPVQKNGNCSVHKVLIHRTLGVPPYDTHSKNFTQNIEICKDEEGVPVVTRENVVIAPVNKFMMDGGFPK
jgi:hypothetical protein